MPPSTGASQHPSVTKHKTLKNVNPRLGRFLHFLPANKQRKPLGIIFSALTRKKRIIRLCVYEREAIVALILSISAHQATGSSPCWWSHTPSWSLQYCDLFSRHKAFLSSTCVISAGKNSKSLSFYPLVFQVPLPGCPSVPCHPGLCCPPLPLRHGHAAEDELQRPRGAATGAAGGGLLHRDGNRWVPEGLWGEFEAFVSPEALTQGFISPRL